MKNFAVLCLLLMTIVAKGQNSDVFKLIKKNNTEEIKLLLQLDNSNEIMSLVNRNEQTPLIYAANLNKLEIVDLFIKKDGVKINAKDGKRKTALDYAKENDNSVMVCHLELATAVFEKNVNSLKKISQITAKQCGMEKEVDAAMQKLISDEYLTILKNPTIGSYSAFIKKYEGLENPYLGRTQITIDSLIDETCRKSGLLGLIKLDGVVPNIWGRINAYIVQNGTLLPESETTALIELYNSNKTSRVSSIMGATSMTTTQNNTFFIPELYFIKKQDFLFFEKGSDNSIKYENICIFKGKCYKMNK